MIMSYYKHSDYWFGVGQSFLAGVVLVSVGRVMQTTVENAVLKGGHRFAMTIVFFPALFAIGFLFLVSIWEKQWYLTVSMLIMAGCYAVSYGPCRGLATKAPHAL
jgi:hypothetical protein